VPFWPALNAKLLELAQTKVEMYDAYISEMEQMPWDESYLQQHWRSFGSRPIRVLTTGNHGVGTFDPARVKDAQQRQYQLDNATDIVVLNARMGQLNDGTTYTSEITLHAQAKNLTVTVQNTGYRKTN